MKKATTRARYTLEFKQKPESVTPIASTLESHRIHLHQGRFPSPAPGLPTTA